MTDPKDIILNAIRVLRSRRVRPSDAKIAWLARREYIQTEEITARTLQELVQCGDVFRVVYKGGTSYRVAPHKVAASNKLLPKPPVSSNAKKVKFTPTPTDILRPLLSAIAVCGDNATKERIAEELGIKGHRTLVDRLDTLLQKELRVGLIGRKVKPSAGVERNIALYYITKNAPLALISNNVGPTPSPPISKDNCNDTEVPVASPDPNPVSSGDEEPKKSSTPFEHLHLHLKKLQEGKEKGDLSKDASIASGDEDTATSAPQSPIVPSQSVNGNEDENQEEVKGKFSPMQIDDNKDQVVTSSPKGNEDVRYYSRRGRPRKAPSIYEDLTNLMPKKDRCRSNRSSTGHRTGRTVKKAKKVFDPSNGPEKKKILPASSQVPSVGGLKNQCSVCGQTSANSTSEDLLECRICSTAAHSSCLGYSQELAMKCRLSPWTCMDCKHCSVCNMDHNTGMLIFCDECDRAYHLTCHNPPIQGYPIGSWICFACSPNFGGQNGYDNINGLLTPSDSPIPDEEARNSSGSWDQSSWDPSIPDASEWCVETVREYFVKKGFAEQAHVFCEQDIDGTALLLLTRSDVLTGLSLKLGPALKIYKQVRILQTRNANPVLP